MKIGNFSLVEIRDKLKNEIDLDISAFGIKDIHDFYYHAPFEKINTLLLCELLLATSDNNADDGTK